MFFIIESELYRLSSKASAIVKVLKIEPNSKTPL